MSDTVISRTHTGRSSSFGRKFLILSLILMSVGFAEGFVTTFYLPRAATVSCALSYGLISTCLILYGARTMPSRAIAEPPRIAPLAIILLAVVLTLALAYGVLRAFPSSADEFGYTYLAGTLRHLRFWNAPLPADLRDVLMTVYVPDQDGKRLSQYPPGWPAVLALLPSLRLSALANPILGLISAVLLLFGLRELRTPHTLVPPLLIIALLAPFTLFNDASFFNHTLTGTCLLAVAFFDLRQRRMPSLWNQVVIGFAFSVVLTTRYEVFGIAFLFYVIDGLLRRRLEFVTTSIATAIAALPVVLLFGYYNWRITGSPLKTTLAWGAPNISYGLHGVGMEGPNSPAQIMSHMGHYGTGWALFASCAVLPFYAIALWRRLASGTIRWFDLMLPAIVLFFVFYPDGGGFQYGPRYWFAGWVMLPLTLAAGFADGRPWRLGRLVFNPVRFGTLQGAAYLGFLAGYAIFAYVQIDARREPLLVAATAPKPAVVLFSRYEVRYVPWQTRTLPIEAYDFTRNGPDGLGPVVLGRDLGPDRDASLCKQFPDRTVWRLRMSGSPPVGRLEPVC